MDPHSHQCLPNCRQNVTAILFLFYEFYEKTILSQKKLAILEEQKACKNKETNYYRVVISF